MGRRSTPRKAPRPDPSPPRSAPPRRSVTLAAREWEYGSGGNVATSETSPLASTRKSEFPPASVT